MASVAARAQPGLAQAAGEPLVLAAGRFAIDEQPEPILSAEFAVIGSVLQLDTYAAVVNKTSLRGARRTFRPVCLIPSNARQEGQPAICLSQSVQYRRNKPKVQAK